jgi:hypothetical protein
MPFTSSTCLNSLSIPALLLFVLPNKGINNSLSYRCPPFTDDVLNKFESSTAIADESFPSREDNKGDKRRNSRAISDIEPATSLLPEI